MTYTNREYVYNKVKFLLFLAIGRLEAQTWCIENGFELVELNPEIASDSETEGLCL